MGTNIQPPKGADSIWREIVNSPASGYWFDAKTIRYWKSRVLWASLECANGKAYFVSSEDTSNPYFGEKPNRRYTVRAWNAETGVETIGELKQYKTARDARAAVRQIVKGAN